MAKQLQKLAVKDMATGIFKMIKTGIGMAASYYAGGSGNATAGTYSSGGYGSAGSHTGPRLAKGGPVEGGMPSLVGENGPELFTPNQSGRIIPNSRMGGGTTITNNINVQSGAGGSDEDKNKLARDISKQINENIKSVLATQMRPGGIMNRTQLGY